MDALAVPAWLAQLIARRLAVARLFAVGVALLGGALARTVAASLGAEPGGGKPAAARNAEPQRREPEQPEPEQPEPEQTEPERKPTRRGLLRRCRTDDPGAYGRRRFHTAPLPGCRSVQWLDERTAGDSSDDDGESVASSEKQEELAAPSAECLRQTRRSKRWSRRFVRIDGDGQLQVFDTRETAQRGGSPKSSSFYLRGCTVSTAETPTCCQLTIRRTDGPKIWVRPHPVPSARCIRNAGKAERLRAVPAGRQVQAASAAARGADLSHPRRASRFCSPVQRRHQRRRGPGLGRPWGVGAARHAAGPAAAGGPTGGGAGVSRGPSGA